MNGEDEQELCVGADHPPTMAIEWSQPYTKIFAALIKAQSEMGAAVKDYTNPFFHSKYADLAENISVCKKPLNDNGIGVFQPLSSVPGGVRVTTIFLHTSGEWMRSELDFPAEKADPQAYGKVATYARRYSLNAFLSIPSEDDDGNAGSVAAAKKPQGQPATRSRPPEPSGPCAPKTSLFKEWAGKPWRDIPQDQLDWFADVINQGVMDPKKAQYKKSNEATLKQIIAEMDRRNRELDEEIARDDAQQEAQP